MASHPERNVSANAVAAAARLLDRPVPAEYLAENSVRFARPKVAEQVKTLSVVVARAGAEWIGLPTAALIEIVAVRPIHSLPHRRAPLLGVANIRGELIVCVSLPDLLGAAAPDGGPIQRLLVVQSPTGRVAFPVAEVGGLHRLHPAELRAAPTSTARANAAFVTQLITWRDRSVGLVDETRLFRAIDTALV